MNFKSINPKDLPIPELHSHLLSAIAPRPIAFASTIDKEGNVNLSPFSFFNVFGANPPIVIFSPARNGRTNTNKHTFENVKETNECVINIVNYPMVEQMSLASTGYDKGVNEFEKAGFTEIESELVKAPRVKEAPVQMECKVMQIIETGDGGGAGNLVICEVIKLHINESYLDENGKIDSVKMDLVARMGGSWYCHATPEAMFEIPKPLQTKGIGVDALPEAIRNSEVLSGNNLGRLGNMETVPSKDAVDSLKVNEDFQTALKNNKVHEFIKRELDKGNNEMALKACFA
jgi:flavin reductase (DIM6/NTAB) family NADH-FMN oxidoreductase RutF